MLNIKEKLHKIVKKKGKGAVIENVLVGAIGLVLTTAFLLIVFSAYSAIYDRLMMKQAIRETILKMETTGGLTSDEAAALVNDLKKYNLYNISIDSPTTWRYYNQNDVGYGERIYLDVRGTYNIKKQVFSKNMASLVKAEPAPIHLEAESTAMY